MRMIFSLLIFLFAFLPASGYSGTIQTTVTTTVTVTSSGQVDINYIIKNTGNDTAHHLSVTTFLALEAQQSDDLGKNPPDGSIRYNCILSPSDFKPGKYTLVSRINFVEQNGTPHRVYHFSSLSYGPDLAKDTNPVLPLEASEPYFNVKSFWQSGNKCKLSLKNSLDVAVHASVILYLPDGFTTGNPERFYQLTPGEKKEEEISLSKDSPVKESRPFHVLLWYEYKGIHYSQLIEKMIVVEDRPVLFKGFLILACFTMIVILSVFFYRKRRGK